MEIRAGTRVIVPVVIVVVVYHRSAGVRVRFGVVRIIVAFDAMLANSELRVASGSGDEQQPEAEDGNAGESNSFHDWPRTLNSGYTEEQSKTVPDSGWIFVECVEKKR